MAINNFTSKIIRDSNGMTIGHCKDLDVAVTGNNTQSPKLNITYKDPDVEGVPYGGTKVVIKPDSYPENLDDGVIIKDIMNKNNHSTTPLVVDLPIDKYNLTKNMYTKLFPYASNGVHNLLGKENDVKEVIWTRKKPQIEATILSLPNGKDSDIMFHPTDPDKLIVFSETDMTLYDYNISSKSVGSAYFKFNATNIYNMLNNEKYLQILDCNKVSYVSLSSLYVNGKKYAYVLGDEIIFLAKLTVTKTSTTDKVYELAYNIVTDTIRIIGFLSESVGGTSVEIGAAGYNTYYVDDKLVISYIYNSSNPTGTYQETKMYDNKEMYKLFRANSCDRWAKNTTKIMCYGFLKNKKDYYSSVLYQTDTIKWIYNHQYPSNVYIDDMNKYSQILTDDTMGYQFIQIDAHKFKCSVQDDGQLKVQLMTTGPYSFMSVEDDIITTSLTGTGITKDKGFNVCTDPDRNIALLKQRTNGALSKVLMLKVVYPN